MNITEQALVLMWKIAAHTPKGCVAIMKTLDDLVGDDMYDQEMIIDARAWAFTQCQQMQIQEASEAWAGEL